MEIPVAKLSLPESVLDQAKDVLRSGMWVDGNHVHALEHDFAEYCGVKYCRAVNNGTAALMSLFGVLNLGPKDEVIVPSFSFIATANAIQFTGAKVVFADINPITYTLDPEDVKEKITKNTKAIMPVHLYGLCADMPYLQEICAENNLMLFEDAAQAHGAAINGKKSGTYGLGAGFSLYPTKNMFDGGEGGLITSNDAAFFDKIKLFMQHGQSQKYIHSALGYNFRMAEVNAVIARYSLSKLDESNSKRRENAKFLCDNLKTIPDLILPNTPVNYTHVYHQFTLRTPKRDALMEAFKKEKIGFGIHYGTPIHLQPYYKALGYTCSLPITEQVCKEVISIPIHPAVSQDQLQFLVEIIKKTLM